MTTTRERLMALADATEFSGSGSDCELARALALAAYRMALDDAEKVCKARVMGVNNREDAEARRCIAAIRKLCERLA